MADFFISYSRADSAFADKLYGALIGRGYTAWMDREKMEGGDKFVQKLQTQIDGCLCLLVLQTPNSITSEWVEKEVKYAIDIGKKVIPLEVQSHRPWFLTTNLNFIDFVRQPFDQAIDNLILSFRSGGTQQRQTNTPGMPVDMQRLYQEGLEAQRKGDLEQALLQWNQILTQEPRFLNGDLAIIVKKLEDQVRPQRINRIKDRAQTAFKAQEWQEMISLVSGLYELDARDTADFALKLLVDGANSCNRTGKWNDEIAIWDQVMRWKADYPHAQERKEVARINLAQSPRYMVVRHYVGQGNTAFAKQELQALWSSAPYYGDPENIAKSLGLNVPTNIIEAIIQKDKEGLKLKQKKDEEQQAYSSKAKRDQEIQEWFRQTETSRINEVAQRYITIGQTLVFVAILSSIMIFIGGMFLLVINSLDPNTGGVKLYILLSVSATFGLLMLLVSRYYANIGYYLLDGIETRPLKGAFAVVFIIYCIMNNIASILLWPFVISLNSGYNARRSNIKSSIIRSIREQQEQKIAQSEQQYQQQLAEIRRRYAEVK